jgi:membrane-associated phospholipid phosphatase
MIAFSRVYIGVHYPSDVLVGAILGACTGMLLVFLLQVTGKMMKLFDF